MPRLLLLLVLLSVFVRTTIAQDKKGKKDPTPRLLYAIPLVVKPGEKQKLALRGKGLVGVKEVTIEGATGASVKFLGAKSVGVPNNYPAERLGDSEVEVELELPKDAKPGAVKLMATGTGGESNTYTLLVRDALAAVAEKEPNDGFAQAQMIVLPCVVEGSINGERDVDVFKFEGKKGDRIRVEVQAARFGSPLDAFATIHDSRRCVVNSADDTSGTADPILIMTLPRDGAYYITVIDANDLGGAPFGYRLVVRKE